MTEASSNTLLHNTLPDRLKRARGVKLVGWQVQVGRTNVLADFVARSAERTEGYDHTGFVMINSKKNCVVSCTCKDHQYRWEAALHEVDSASIIYSNGEPALITNPENLAGVCKHCTAAVLRLQREMQTPQLQKRITKARNTK